MRKSIAATIEKMLKGCGSWKPIFETTWKFVKATGDNSLGVLFVKALGGHTEARYDLGWYFVEGEEGLSKNERLGLLWIWLAAEAGDGWAVNNLATMVERGQGVEANPPEAFRLYKIAAEMGVPQAKQNLARCYRCGRCGGRDEAEAERLEAEAKASIQ